MRSVHVRDPSFVQIYVIFQMFMTDEGEADEDQRKVLKGMTEVAKDKETGPLNESAESIKVIDKYSISRDCVSRDFNLHLSVRET